MKLEVKPSHVIQTTHRRTPLLVGAVGAPPGSVQRGGCGQNRGTDGWTDRVGVGWGKPLSACAQQLHKHDAVSGAQRFGAYTELQTLMCG